MSRSRLNEISHEAYGCSPMILVLRRRLDAVRRAIEADPTEELTVLCGRFGIEHQGRFAHYYRAQLGSCPARPGLACDNPASVMRGRRRLRSQRDRIPRMDAQAGGAAFEVEPERLITTAQTCATAGRDLSRVRDLFALDEIGAAMPQSRSQHAAEHSEASMRGHLDQLAMAVALMADALLDSARKYTATDDTGAGRLAEQMSSQ